MALDQEWVDYYTARLERMSDKVKEIRERVKEDLYSFAVLMNPGYMYGEIHKEIFKWLEGNAEWKRQRGRGSSTSKKISGFCKKRWFLRYPKRSI